MEQLLQWVADSLRGVRVWFVVLPWERAVRIRAGRYARLFGPGVHWRVPLLDQQLVFNTRLQVTPFPTLTVTTKDDRTVTAAGLVGLRIIDPLQAMLAIRQPAATCASLAMAAAASYLTGSRFSEVSPEGAERAAHQALERQVPGVLVEFVRIVGLRLREDLPAAPGAVEARHQRGPLPVTGQGQDWLRRARGVTAFSPLGSRVAEIFDAVWHGIYHLDARALGRVRWDDPEMVEFVWSGEELATYDFPKLTGLVVLAHDAMVRLAVMPAAPNRLRLRFHLRQRREGGHVWERHPPIDAAIESWRAVADLRHFELRSEPGQPSDGSPAVQEVRP